ncbi:DUF605-domain-containing protein [Ascodesmis nigricans]|uniref:DUF605-domain-containing protein n=1 Tax=Ascodesmis nigricans TaxID=341454 RepID=A0A4S2MZK0_9PEZI|nr:DUF605-domain-containing protein [Ascodesmis nigricans]
MPPKALGKPPDDLESITPFILRGKQMIRADPIITYWCFHWAMKLAWELQESRQEKSDEARHYMLALMDELETRKGAVAESEKELVEVDIAAQAYVENFAGKILEKGRKAVEEERETANTVETLLAASVFLEVLRIFSPDGQLDEETTKKVKFAKYHAVRIRAALRKKDSNIIETPSPLAEPDTTTTAPSIAPNPTVEEVPDSESNSPPPTQPTISVNTTPAAPPTAPPTAHPPAHPPVHPPAPASPSYFPPTPEIHEPTAPTLSPTTMSSANTIFPDITHADHTYPAPSPPQPPSSTMSIPSPPQQPTFGAPALPSLPTSYYTGAPSPGISAPHHPQPQNYYHQQQPIPQPQSEIASRPRKEIMPEDMAKAQKFARWAISALDYEDVENAIEQFRSGLKALGAL